MKENNNQTVVQESPEQVEKKKGISPFWKGVLTTVAVGATVYAAVKYRKEIVSCVKSAAKKGKGLFAGKKNETVVVNEVVFAEQSRPNRTTNNQHQHNKQGWNNPNKNR